MRGRPAVGPFQELRRDDIHGKQYATEVDGSFFEVDALVMKNRKFFPSRKPG
jgi:hypothetical protein